MKLMSMMPKIIIVGFALGLELIFALTFNVYPHGEEFAVGYRLKEREAAWFDCHQHPSPTTIATFQDEMRLMHEHEDWKKYVIFGLLIVLNVVVIYFFLKKA